jgi:hypothetical protein
MTADSMKGKNKNRSARGVEYVKGMLSSICRDCLTDYKSSRDFLTMIELPSNLSGESNRKHEKESSANYK